MSIRALESRLAKLEKSVKAAPIRKKVGFRANCLYTIDGGRSACDWDQRPMGVIDPDELDRIQYWSLVVHPESEIPLAVNNQLCHPHTWFPMEENGADHLLSCGIHGAIAFESVLAGCVPFGLSVSEDYEILSPWASWKEENRISELWGGYRLPDRMLDFIDFLDDEWLSETWRLRQESMVKAYRQTDADKEKAKKVELEKRRDQIEWQIRSMCAFGYRNPVPAPGKVITGMDEYLDENGRMVRKRRLLLGSGDGQWRLPDPDDQKTLEELKQSIQTINDELASIRGAKKLKSAE